METRGKSINLFLMDGTASGRIKATLANWTGVSYKIPRTELDKCKNREDLQQSGVYFLFGKSEETEESVAYIGQAGARKNGEGILYRLQEHKRDTKKDYWSEAVVFTTSNNSFGPTEISYLEHHFYKRAIEVGRYTVTNLNDPNIGNVTEEKESELEEFMEYAEIIMGALGHKIFEPISREIKNEKEPEEILYFNTINAEASGRRTADGFVVLKNSHIASKLQKSCPANAKRNREKYADRISDDWLLLEDLLFSSPSAAAGFVGGSSLSGNEMWKLEDGTTLKQLETLEE